MSKVTFEIKGTEYEVPNFLSIENYVKIYKVKDFLGEEYFQAKLINTIFGIQLEQILKSNHHQIGYIANQLLELFPNNDYPFYDTFTLNGIEYGFIPSWKNMTFAEFVDLDTLMSKDTDSVIDNLHIITAIMYRPVINKKSEHDFDIEDYDVKTMEKRAELFKKQLDIKYALGGQFFFSRFAIQLSNPILPYLTLKKGNIIKRTIFTWKNRKLIWKILLRRRSDGMLSSTELVEMILQNMNMSLKPPFWKRLTNYFGWLKKKKNQ